MKSRKLGIPILLCIVLGAFFTVDIEARRGSGTSKGKKVVTKKKEKKGEAKEETKENIRELRKQTSGFPIISAIIRIAESITKEIESDIKLSEIISLIGITEGPVAQYLDKFVIKTPIVEAVPHGMKIKGTIVVNNNPLTAVLEIGRKSEKSYNKKDKKEEKQDKKTEVLKKSKKEKTKSKELKKVGGGWYVLFYIESPKKWLLSDYFPDVLDLKKIFPGIDFNALAAKGQPLKPDLFELEESYFYISTIELGKKHDKIKEVKKGVGFSGKLRFIGLLSILDKVFGLNGKPVECEGAIVIPKFIGSNFTIKIPTETVILPEYMYIGKKRVQLVPGFKIALAPHEFGITFVAGIPILRLEGGIKVDLPFVKETLWFYSGLNFSGIRFKIYGGQRSKLTDLFGIKDLHADEFMAGLIWDLIISAKFAAATTAVGGIGALIPSGIMFKGGVQSGKSKLNIEADVSLHGTKGLDLYYKSSGSLFVRDFVKFWLGMLVKDPKAMAVFLKIVPPFIFEDIDIEAAWSEEKGKKFELSIGRVELIPNVPARMRLKISEEGLIGQGSIAPFFLPNKQNPIIEVTRKDNKEKGPYFDLKALISPPGFSLESDGRIAANLGALGKIDSGTKIKVSNKEIDLSTNTTILDVNAYLDIGAKFGGRLEDWYVRGGFSQKATEKIKKALNKATEELLKVAEELKKRRDISIKENNKIRDRAIADLDKAKNRAVADIRAHFDSLKKGTQWRIDNLLREIREWKAACNKKHWVEKPWCYLFQVATREVAVAALRIHKDITLNIVSAVAQVGTQAALETAKLFTRIGIDTKRNFEVIGLSIGEAFTRAAAEITKIVNIILTEIFVIHNFKFDANLADLKLLKLPYIELDMTLFGKRPKEPLRLQLDMRNPAKFFVDLARYIFQGTNLKKLNNQVDKKSEPVMVTISKTTEKDLSKARALAKNKLNHAKREAEKKSVEALKEAKLKSKKA